MLEITITERNKLARLPLNSRIEARNSLASVRRLPRNQHVPDGLRGALLLQHLVDLLASSAFAELHIAIVQYGCVSSPKRKRRRHGIRYEGGRFCRLVNLKRRHRAVEARRRTYGVAGDPRGEDAVVPVVKKREGEFSRGVLADK